MNTDHKVDLPTLATQVTAGGGRNDNNNGSKPSPLSLSVRLDLEALDKDDRSERERRLSEEIGESLSWESSASMVTSCPLSASEVNPRSLTVSSSLLDRLLSPDCSSCAQHAPSI